MIAATASARDEPVRRFIEGMRVLSVSGILAGVLLIGAGSRLSMLLLRVTSPDRVHGVTSDDGFTIGRVTVGGTYNLLLIGAAAGIIGAGIYQLVAPWLIGPTWFRRMTTGLASAAVVGSMLVHADGIDFNLLKPTWLAIGLFVALPGLFGTLIGPIVDAVGRPDSWTNRGRRRWIVPVIAVGCFPLSLLVLAFASVFVGACVLVGEVEVVQRTRKAPLYGLTLRVVWLAVAVVGLVALINDTRAVTGTSSR